LLALTSFIASTYEKFIISVEGIENWSGPKVWLLWKTKKTMYPKHDIDGFTTKLIVRRYSKGFQVYFIRKSDSKEVLIAQVGSEDEAKAKALITKVKLTLQMI